MKQVYIILTKDCNLSCSFCIRDYSQNMEYELSISNIDKILKEVKDNFPNTTIILSGGEPTLHDSFSLILEKSCKLFEKVTINTNGTTDFFRTSQFLKLNKEYKINIQFSLDGDEKLHNTIRGANNYKKTLDTIIFCNQLKNIHITIATTVTNKKFLNNFIFFYNDMKKLKNIRWNVKRVSYSGEADIKNYDYLKNEDWNAIVDYIQNNDSSHLINIFKTFDFDDLENIDDALLDKLSKKVVRNCGSGINKIYIYPNMDVLACTCYEKFPSGNLLKDSLQNILKSKNHLKITNQVIDNITCNSCRYKKICNGGCLGAGYFTYNKHNIADIKCPKIYECSNI